jgi:transposase-like protein
MVSILLQSMITCPFCGFSKQETMATDSCLRFYQCDSCGKTITPKRGDCCVFCSYGTVACPPKQQEMAPGE